MTYREPLSQTVVAISISESPGMAPLGLAPEHLVDAMAETARHLLALGSRLAYGGDLRPGGFTELLYELVVRHRRDADLGDTRPAVVHYMPWPAHCARPADEIRALAGGLNGLVEIHCLDANGADIPLTTLDSRPSAAPTAEVISTSLTQMRAAMTQAVDGRVVLGGRVTGYQGRMPGIAEEALCSLRAGQPLFVLGGFGGCAGDIAESLGLAPASAAGGSAMWPDRTEFASYGPDSLNNGLDITENEILARTVHVDQAVALLLRGLVRVVEAQQGAPSAGLDAAV